MSAIKKQLVELTDVTAKRGEDEQDHLKRLVRGVADLSDKDWDSLSPEAQAWYNDAASALNKKKDIPGFPDAQKEDEAPARRGRAPVKEEKPATPEVGDNVKITTKRDKIVEGKLTEIDGDVFVVDTGSEEVEISNDRIASIEVVVVDSKGAADQSGADEPGDPKVGDTVKITTKRNKEVEGELVEIDGDTYIIKSGKEELEVGVDSIKTCEIVKPEAAPRGRASAPKDDKKADKKADESKDEKKRVTSKSNGGTSVTTRCREIVCEDPSLTKDEVIKALEKDGLEFRETTIDLVYADTQKVIGILRDLKKIK